ILLLSILIILGLSTLGISAYLQLHSYNEVVDDTATHSQIRSDVLVQIQDAAIGFKTQVQEWKNILIRGNDAEQFTQYIGRFTEAETLVQNHLATALELEKKEGMPTDAVVKLQKEHAELGKNYREALKSFDKNDPDAGKIVDRLVNGMDREASNQMQSLADNATQEFEQYLTDSDLKTERIYSNTIRLLLIICLSASVIIIAVMVYI